MHGPFAGSVKPSAGRQDSLEDLVVCGVVALHFLVGWPLVQGLEPAGCVRVVRMVPQPESPHDRQIGGQPFQSRRIDNVHQTELPASHVTCKRSCDVVLLSSQQYLAL